MPADPNHSAMPGWVPAFNNLINNRVQGLWAPYIKPYAVIIHTGRKSGKQFRTPVIAVGRGDQLGVALLYSANCQWVKNLQAAGGGEVLRRRKRYRLVNPQVLTDAPAGTLPRSLQRALGRGVPVLTFDLAPL